EPAAVGQIANETDACPSCRRQVLIRRTNGPRIRQSYEVSDLNRKGSLLDRSRKRIAGDGLQRIARVLANQRYATANGHKQGRDEPHGCTHGRLLEEGAPRLYQIGGADIIRAPCA